MVLAVIVMNGELTVISNNRNKKQIEKDEGKVTSFIFPNTELPLPATLVPDLTKWFLTRMS